MALMKPIEAPRYDPCHTCRQWQRVISHALGACRLVPYDQRHDAKGRIVRENHKRSDEQFACHEPRLAA